MKLVTNKILSEVVNFLANLNQNQMYLALRKDQISQINAERETSETIENAKFLGIYIDNTLAYGIPMEKQLLRSLRQDCI